MAKVRWGVLSTASIARLVIEATCAADHAAFVAVASRDAARARAFAGELGLEASFGSYEELPASSAVDAVYVPLPVALHTEWTVKPLAAGKHVLCEKPLATSAADAARCLDAAEAAGRHCVEGLMPAPPPQTTLARELVTGGAIGRLAYVRAALTVSVPRTTSAARSSSAAAPSATSAATASAPSARSPANPAAVCGDPGPRRRRRRPPPGRHPGACPGDVLAQFDIALDLIRRDELELVGTEARLTIPDPWLCRAPHLELSPSGRVERIPIDPDGASVSPTPTTTSTASSSTPPRRPSPRRRAVVRLFRRARPGDRAGGALPLGRARLAGVERGPGAPRPGAPRTPRPRTSGRYTSGSTISTSTVAGTGTPAVTYSLRAAPRRRWRRGERLGAASPRGDGAPQEGRPQAAAAVAAFVVRSVVSSSGSSAAAAEGFSASGHQVRSARRAVVAAVPSRRAACRCRQARVGHGQAPAARRARPGWPAAVDRVLLQRRPARRPCPWSARRSRTR